MKKTTIFQKLVIVISVIIMLLLIAVAYKSGKIIATLILASPIIFYWIGVFFWGFGYIINPIINLIKILNFKQMLKEKNICKAMMKVFFTSEGRLNRQLYVISSTLASGTALSIVFILEFIYIYFSIRITGSYSTNEPRIVSTEVLSFAISIVPIYCVTLKRYHDLGKSKKWVYAYIIIWISSIFYTPILLLLALMNIHLIFFKGNVLDNPYGSSPLNSKNYNALITAIFIPFILSIVIVFGASIVAAKVGNKTVSINIVCEKDECAKTTIK